MIESLDWPSAYLVVSSLLGEAADISVATVAGAETPSSTALAAGLHATSRDVRARAIARAATALALEIERSGLA